MFYYIKGVVAALLPHLTVVDCGGVGYALSTTDNTQSALETGKTAKLYTHCHIREDCFDLYGFFTQSEKHCFELLIGVSGVGPRAALSILSFCTPENLALSVLTGDEKSIMRAHGIGKKIAQRVILELKDKMSGEMASLPGAGGGDAQSVFPGGSKSGDAAAALAVLGYGPGDISRALRDIDIEAMPLEDVIRQALRTIVKA